MLLHLVHELSDLHELVLIELQVDATSSSRIGRLVLGETACLDQSRRGGGRGGRCGRYGQTDQTGAGGERHQTRAVHHHFDAVSNLQCEMFARSLLLRIMHANRTHRRAHTGGLLLLRRENRRRDDNGRR